MERLKKKIRNIPDFPIPGINFKDVTTLIKDADAFRSAIESFVQEYAEKQIDYVIGIEARGFILGPVLANLMGKGFIPVRKAGKLPSKTRQVKFGLEYGTDVLEVHIDALQPGDRVVILDDLLATGGTAAAACQLVEEAGSIVVGVGFLIELTFLEGRKKVGAREVFSLLKYDS